MSRSTRIIIGLLLAFLVNIPSALSSEKVLKIISEFPSERQMIAYDYVLGRGTRFDADEKAIFFCSQRQHVVLKIDFHGNLIQRIGRSGQGPGELNLPLFPYLFGDLLLISDNGNSRIQIFTLDGTYIRQIRMIEGIDSLVSIENHLYMLLLKRYEKSRNSPAIFGKYEMNGKLVRYFGEIGKTDYNDFYYDNAQTVRTFQEQIHSLQLYGTTYRIYNRAGKLVREFQLEINPLHDREYKKTGWLYAYRSFAVDKQRIYATHAGKGRLIINVFDSDGKYLYTHSIKQETSDIYEVSDMKIIQQESRKLLLLFVHYPDTKFILAEIND